MIFPLEGGRGRKPRPTILCSYDMKYTAERFGREEDLCRVRLVCRALSMTWISPPARLHHIVLVPKKNPDQTQSESALRAEMELRTPEVPFSELSSFQPWKRWIDSILFCFKNIRCQFAKLCLLPSP